MFWAFKLSLDVATLAFGLLFPKNWAKLYSISGHTVAFFAKPKYLAKPLKAPSLLFMEKFYWAGLKFD
jgi:hypothetical protein